MFVSLFPKNDFVFVNQISHYKALSHYSMVHRIRFRFLTEFETHLQKTPIKEERFRKVSSFGSLPQKNGFVFVVLIDQIWHYKALNRYLITQKTRFRS